MAILKALNYLSFPGGLENTFDVFEAIQATKEHGFEALELCVGDTGVLTTDATEAYCAEIRKAADGASIKLPSLCSGLYWSRALGDDDPAAREQAKDDLRKMIRIASWLGAKTLLTIPGAVDVFFLPDRPAM